MTTNELSQILQMARGALTDGVTAVQPLAVEIVREYQLRAATWAAACFLMAGICGYVVYRAWMYLDDEINDSRIAIGVFALVLAGMIGFFGMQQLGDAVAPICGLVGK